MVDAGMRHNETGYMHNRVRMVVASFMQAFINRVAVGRGIFC
jgi:deoxyribodipyrimidine photolyase